MAAAITTTQAQDGGRSRKKSGVCYQCGSDQHLAKVCPKAVCRICGEGGHNVGGCPEKPLPPVDMGRFQATITDNNTSDADADAGFTYAELFAGIGGFRIALDKLGGKCVFASEVDRFCIKNYEMNFGGDRPAGDICRIESQQIPNHDLLVGGFPCQPFSGSGSRLGVEDPSGRGVLFREIVRLLKCKQPRVFLLENVRGLLSHDGGQTLQLIMGELEGCGYFVSYKLVDAVNILPQERCRLFFVGIRRDLKQEQDENNIKDFAFPSLPNLKRGVEDIIQLQMDPLEFEKLLLSRNQLKKVRAQRYTQEHPEARFLSNRKLPSKTIQSSYTKYMVGSQFINIIQSANNDDEGADENENGGGDEYLQWRRFSSREVARLQGFPESFILCKDRAHHMLGNAVCPPVIASIAAPLLQYAQIRIGGCRSSEKVFLSDAAAAADDDDVGWSIAKSMLIEGSPNDSRRVGLIEKLGSYR